MQTEELNFDLPPELIAQIPPAERTDSRLMHYQRADRGVRHRVFSDLPGLLRTGDLLVFNDARVLPARFVLRKKDTRGRVEGLFLEETPEGRWKVLLRNLGRCDRALQFLEAPDVEARVVRSAGLGGHEIELSPPISAAELLGRVGRMPLPPYIRRGKDHDERDELDRSRYQTVFARAPGAVAAPTAALHFSQGLLQALGAGGIERTFVTLHVGPGTFRPVVTRTLEAHAMHVERYSISEEAAGAVNRARAQGRRIIAVGTTAARVLESQPPDRPIAACSGETGIFIYPPHAWRHVDALITNFHLPRSTLIALVAAMIGLDEQRRLYQIAIEERYRFFSYGDAMIVL